MAVRFLPPPEERQTPPREEHEDLAEVIEFRTRLRRPEPEGDGDAAAGTDEPAAAAPQPSRLPAEEAAWPRLITLPRDRSTGGSGRAARSLASSNPAGGDAPGDGDAPEGVDTPEAGDAPEASRGPRNAGGRPGAAGDAADTWAGGHAGKGNTLVAAEPTAYELAVKLLSRRQLSSGELHRALVAAGQPEIDAEEAVAHCIESLYLDDEDLAHAVASKLRESKGESKARIRQKLRERYLPDAAIEGALAELDDDTEHELLRQTANDRARRMTGLDRQTAERRLLGFLARRGWTGERATKATRDALDAHGLGAKSTRSAVRFQ